MASGNKKKTPSRITRALSHYETALSLFQQEMASLPAEKATEIDLQVQAFRDRDLAYSMLAVPPMMRDLHDGGDVLRIAKQILDPKATLSSTTPDLPEPPRVG